MFIRFKLLVHTTAPVTAPDTRRSAQGTAESLHLLKVFVGAVCKKERASRRKPEIVCRLCERSQTRHKHDELQGDRWRLTSFSLQTTHLGNCGQRHIAP